MFLRGKGIEEFCPTYLTVRRWSDRKKEIRRPLIPGYVFCRIDLSQRIAVLETQGVVSIVGTGKTPVAISDHEIQTVRTIVESSPTATPWPYIRAGHRVVLQSGPLAGTEGIVLDVKNKLKLIVSIELLQRSVATEVDRESVRPLDRQHVLQATA